MAELGARWVEGTTMELVRQGAAYLLLQNSSPGQGGGFRGLPRWSCSGNSLVMVVTVRSLSAGSPLRSYRNLPKKLVLKLRIVCLLFVAGRNDLGTVDRIKNSCFRHPISE